MDSALPRTFLSDDDKQALRRLLGAFEPVRSVRRTMPLQHFYSFLLVALEEGSGVVDYATRAGVSESVMSRHLLDIGDRNRKRELGHGLVTKRQHPDELRKSQVWLTDKGRKLVGEIAEALRAKSDREAKEM